MKAAIVLKELKNAGSLFLKNWLLVLPSVFIDLIFLVVISTAYFLTAAAVMDRLNSMLSTVVNNLSKFSGSAKPDINTLVSQQLFMQQEVAAVLTFVFSFAVIALLVWLLLESASWKLSLRIAGIKTRYFSYLTQFSLFSVVWWAIVSGVGYGFFKTTFASLVEASNTQWALNVLFLVILVAVFYFGTLSFALFGKIKDVLKEIYSVGILRAPLVLLSFLIVVAMYAVLFLLFWYVLVPLNPIAAIVVGMVILLPLMTFTRVYSILVVNELKK